MLLVVLIASTLGCSSEEEEVFDKGGGSICCEGDTGAGDDTGDSGDTGESPPLQDACETVEKGSAESVPAVVFSAEATWALIFDADAQAAGFSDCSYTRAFEGVQVLDLDYDCPECDLIVRGTATMMDGLECYSAVFGDTEETRTEMWGVSDAGFLYRSGRDQYPMGELAEFTSPTTEGESVAVAWESEYDMTEGGKMTLFATATMSWQTDEGTLLDDPWAPREYLYDCGWECNDTGDLVMDYALAVGSTFPNVRLEDQCGDMVDLWDFYGSYLVIDASQYDCGPCRSMAEAEPAFVDQMRREGIPVRVITMMGNGLSESWGTPDDDTVDWWISEYGLTDPVLKDRGFTQALLPDFFTAFSGEDYGFPAWVVVDPEMKLIYGNIGFSSWDAVSEVIQADHGR